MGNGGSRVATSCHVFFLRMRRSLSEQKPTDKEETEKRFIMCYNLPYSSCLETRTARINLQERSSALLSAKFP